MHNNGFDDRPASYEVAATVANPTTTTTMKFTCSNSSNKTQHWIGHTLHRTWCICSIGMTLHPLLIIICRSPYALRSFQFRSSIVVSNLIAVSEQFQFITSVLLGSVLGTRIWLCGGLWRLVGRLAMQIMMTMMPHSHWLNDWWRLIQKKEDLLCSESDCSPAKLPPRYCFLLNCPWRRMEVRREQKKSYWRH